MSVNSFVPRPRKNPSARASKVGHLGPEFGHLRDYLYARATVSNNGDSLACVIVFWIPSCRVHNRAPKRVQSLNLRLLPATQKPSGGYQNVTLIGQHPVSVLDL